MKGLATWVLGLLILQVPAVQNTICTNNQLTLEEMVRRLEAKVEAAFDIQQSMKLRFEADRSLQKAELKETITACDTVVENATAIMKHSESTQQVSFMSVRATGSTISSRAIVVFETVRHSKAPTGYGYNSADGRFRCPYNGTYLFFVNIMGDYSSSSGNARYKFHLKRGSTILSTATSDIMTDTHADDVPMSAMAVTPCSKGEYVYVQNADSATRKIWANSNGPTHFTGFRIY